jgi:hypothetical protein
MAQDRKTAVPDGIKPQLFVPSQLMANKTAVNKVEDRMLTGTVGNKPLLF